MIVDAITSGDLTAFKNCCVRKHTIDLRLLQYRELHYTPKYNKEEQYVKICGPTMTMLAILSEQDEILDFILDKLGPDLSIQVSGFTALHLAALIKDSRPLQLLLHYQWIQENIDVPLNLKGIKADVGDFTTALHCAVSNRRIPQALLLLSDLPPYKIMSPNETEDDGRQTYRAANVDQRSANGSTPVYIAVSLRDVNLVRVLMAANADPTIRTRSGKDALELARELRAAAEEFELKKMEAEIKDPRRKKLHRKSVNPAIRIAQILASETPLNESLEDLMVELAPWVVPRVMGAVDGDGEEEDYSDDEPGAGKAKGAAGTNPDMLEILNLVRSLDDRLRKMEAARYARPPDDAS
jgi:hypothetical protein